MPVLHLGIADIPYTGEPVKTSIRKSVRSTDTLSTGDVAEILEDKYGVMEHFYELHHGAIDNLLADSLAMELESMLQGAPPGRNPYAAAADKIQHMFHVFIEQKEIDALGVPGVPTQASLEGRTARTKNQRGPPRPSFYFSGLYEQTFAAWVD